MDNENKDELYDDNLILEENYLKKNILTIAAYFFAMIIVSNIVALIAAIIIHGIDPNIEKDLLETKLLFWANIVTSIMILIGSVILLKNDLVTDFKSLLNKKTFIYIGAIAIGFIVYYYATFILNMIYLKFNVNTQSENQATIESLMTGPYLIPMVLMTGLFAPIYEELIFRKSIFALIKKPWIAFIVSSILFAGIHVVSGGDFILIFAYLIPSLVFGALYWYCDKNIYVTIAIHMLNNIISVIAVLLV